jgi:hypothetical protein
MNLPRDGIKLNAYIKSSNLPQAQGQEIKEKRPVPLGVDRHHPPFDILPRLAENVLKIRGLSTEPCSVVDNLALNLIFTKINKRH